MVAVVLAWAAAAPDLRAELEREIAPDPRDRHAARIAPPGDRGWNLDDPLECIAAARTGNAAARRRCAELLDCDDPVVLAHAIRLLPAARPRRATARLAELTAHEHPAVALAAARALRDADPRGWRRLVRDPTAAEVAALETAGAPSDAGGRVRAWLMDAATRRRAAWLVLASDPLRAAIRRVAGTAEWTTLLPLPTADMPDEDRAAIGALLRDACVMSYAQMCALFSWEAEPVRRWALSRVDDPDRRDLAWIPAAITAVRMGRAPEEMRTRLASRLGADDAARWGELWRIERARLAYRESDAAIAAGVAWLRATQRPDGRWNECTCGQRADSVPWNEVGATALAVYTLLWCDVRPDDPAILRGLGVLADAAAEEWQRTYTAALIVMAAAKFEEAGGVRAAVPRLRRRMEDAVRWLCSSQQERERNPTGAAPGCWSYHPGMRWDNSNTQFAILGLAAGRSAGADVPVYVWQRALEHWRRCFFGRPRPLGARGSGTEQHSGSDVPEGWAYLGAPGDPNAARPSASMTAAGICSILVIRSILENRPTREIAQEDGWVGAGIRGLERIHGIPAGGHTDWPMHGLGTYYTLYSIERAMVLAGVRRLGEVDWYVDGANYIMASQRTDGSWWDVADTCFALLFLKRATPAVITGD